MDKSVFQTACNDIRTNLWVLGPHAQQQIINWFVAISGDAYDRGVTEGKRQIAASKPQA